MENSCNLYINYVGVLWVPGQGVWAHRAQEFDTCGPSLTLVKIRVASTWLPS